MSDAAVFPLREVIDGHPVLGRIGIGGGRSVVLVSADGYLPFVTGLCAEGETGWSDGHYFSSLDEARADLFLRGARGG